LMVLRYPLDGYEAIGRLFNPGETLVADEYLVVQMRANGGNLENVVSTDCAMFLLNGEGKTVDSVRCNCR